MVDRVGQEEKTLRRHALRELEDDGNDHRRLRNGENGGLLARHDTASTRRILVTGAFVGSDESDMTSR